MFFDMIDTGNLGLSLLNLAERLIVVFIALTFHEVAHGYTAYKLGDDTAKRVGRLSLNPFKHLSVSGFLCMLIAGFGWAKPVPIDARRFRKPKLGMAISALAGPVTNLLLAVFIVIPYELMFKFLPDEVVFALLYDGVRVPAEYLFTYNLASAAIGFIYTFHFLNLSLAVFNFLPMPPLDGSRVMYSFLPSKLYFGVMKYERYISLAIMLLLLFGFLDFPLSWAVSKISYGIQWLIPIV